MIDSTAINTILTAGAAARPAVDRKSSPSHILAPEGFQLLDVPAAEFPPLPDHIRQSVTLRDPDSFARYVKRYKDSRTLLFSTLPEGEKDAAFLAVFDYHHGTKEGDGGTGDTDSGVKTLADRCAHRATYPCPFSIEWNEWQAIDGVPFTQRDFIDFIDEHAPDVTQPDSASLMEFAMNFSSKTEVKFQSNVNRTVRGTFLTYQEEAAAGAPGQIQVPAELKLNIPVFEGGKPFPLTARIEWDPRGGSLKITVKLQRAARVMREALDDIRAEIEAATEIEPLTGAPSLPAV